MEDKNKQNDDHETTPQFGSGAMLAAERKKQGKSIDEIADELNLSLTQIRAIELDQNEGLPEPTYVRGYIRSYAKLLGLNAEQVLEHYLNKNWQKSTNLDDMPRGIGDGEPEESPFLSPARVIVFLLLAGLVVFFWLKGGDIFGDQSQQATEQIVSQPSEGVTIVGAVDSPIEENPELLEGGEDLAEGVADAELSIAGETEASTESDQTAPTADVAQEISQTTVTMTFTETSWIDIRDEQQNRLAYRSYPVGETLEVSAEGVLSVLIGNVKGVQMTLNGQPYDLSQHTNGVYAKFRVGEATE